MIGFVCYKCKWLYKWQLKLMVAIIILTSHCSVTYGFDGSGGIEITRNIELTYTVGELLDVYDSAVSRGSFFDESNNEIFLPFKTSEARQDFFYDYSFDTWYLIDAVYAQEGELIEDPSAYLDSYAQNPNGSRDYDLDNENAGQPYLGLESETPEQSGLNEDPSAYLDSYAQSPNGSSDYDVDNESAGQPYIGLESETPEQSGLNEDSSAYPDSYAQSPNGSRDYDVDNENAEQPYLGLESETLEQSGLNLVEIFGSLETDNSLPAISAAYLVMNSDNILHVIIATNDSTNFTVLIDYPEEIITNVVRYNESLVSPGAENDMGGSIGGTHDNVSSDNESVILPNEELSPKPGSEDPGSEDPGSEDPGSEDPGSEDPGSEDPGSEDPGSVDPGSEDLDNPSDTDNTSDNNSSGSSDGNNTNGDTSGATNESGTDNHGSGQTSDESSGSSVIGGIVDLLLPPVNVYAAEGGEDKASKSVTVVQAQLPLRSEMSEEADAKPGVSAERFFSEVDVDGTKYTEWTIVYNIPGALYGEPLWLDDLNDDANTSVLCVPEDFSVEARKTSGDSVVIFDYSVFDPTHPYFIDEWDGISSWTLYFIDELAGDNGNSVREQSELLSFSPFEEDTAVTVTYKIPVEQELALQALLALEYSSDLSKFTKSIVIVDSKGNPIKDGDTVISGDDYKITLEFAEKPGFIQFEYDSDGFLTYELPDGIEVPYPRSGAILGDGTSEIGEYEISADGKVSVKFYKVNDNDNFIDFYENAIFTLNLEARFEENEGEQVIVFGDNVKITVNVEKARIDLVVDKISTGYNESDKTIDYTITIKALGGAVKNINLNDIMTAYPETISANDISITSVKHGDRELATTEYEITPNGNVFNISFKEGVLKDGETITIKYTLKNVDRLVDAKVVAVTNVAKATGKDVYEREVVGSDNTYDKLDSTFFQKKGSVSTDNNGNMTITWDVYVGDGKTKLNGKTITDTLGEGLAFSGGANNVTVYLKDKDESNLSITRITANENERSFSYDVIYNQDVYYVQFIYTTSVKDPVQGKKYYNTVSITIDGVKDHTAEVEVYKYDVKKTSKFINVDGVDYVEYTVVNKIPALLNGKSLWFEDELYVYIPDINGNLYSRNVEANPVDFKITVENEGVKVDDWADYYLFTDAEYSSYIKPYLLLLCFYKEGLPASVRSIYDLTGASTSPFDKDTTLTITYKIPLSARILNQSGTAVDTELDMTLGEVLRTNALRPNKDYSYGRVINTIYMKNSGGNLKTDSDTLFWPIYKNGKPSGESNTYEYEVQINPAESKLDVRDIASLVFTDTFDSRLKYVGGTFQIVVSGSTNATYNGTYRLASDPNIVDNGNKTSTMTVDLSNIGAPSGWYQDPNCSYTISYKLEVAEPGNLPLGEIEFKNTAAIIVDGVSFSDDFTIKTGEKIVDKTMVPDGNIAEVKITINEKGIDLAPGADVITVHDKMSETLALYPSSIKVMAEINGVWEEKTLTYNGTGVYSYSTNGSTEIEFILPDRTPLIITYSVLILGAMGQSVDIENVVEVVGSYSTAGKKGYVITKSDAYGNGKRLPVTLVKVDAEDDKKLLEGAEFTLYAGYDCDNKTQPVEKFDIDGKIFYKIATGKTNANGVIVFDHSSLLPGYSFVYALEETKAPDGYVLPENRMDRVTLFTFDMLTVDELKEFTKEVRQIAGIIDITNEAGDQLPEAGGSGIALFTTIGLLLMSVSSSLMFMRRRRGHWFAKNKSAGRKGASTFMLERCAPNGVPLTGPDAYSDTTTGAVAGGFKFELKGLAAGTYYYKIRERSQGEECRLQDTGEYIVRVEVSADYTMGVDVVYPGEGNLEFVNTYALPPCGGPELPETGGRGAVQPRGVGLLFARNRACFSD